MIRSRIRLAAALGFLLSAATQVEAGVLTFWLDAPVVSGSTAKLDVRVQLDGLAGDQVEAIQLNVEASSAGLTEGATDYSRFAFDLDATNFPTWSAIVDIAAEGTTFFVPDDPIAGPFLLPDPTPIRLGTIVVDLTGLSAGGFEVNIEGGSPFFTDGGGLFGGELVTSMRSSETHAVRFGRGSATIQVTSAVPEPATFSMLAGAGLAAALIRRRRAS
ncbi:MAG: PEP-CTERM sorting domain-containing protein [Isosphaeraceae bacterium]|nr:PEP-CTERM sorting domain-containing protein [Isosphaeraceae bacterium]